MGISYVNFVFSFKIWIVYCAQFSLMLSYTSALQGIIPNPRVELWKPPGNNIKLIYVDNHLAAYFDTDIDTTITWPFSPLSWAWKYTKNTYGSFGPDPRLYLLLHNRKYNECTNVTLRSNETNYRNIIECGDLGSESNGWIHNSSANLEKLLSSLGQVIWHGAYGLFNDADLEVSFGKMQDIVVYDIYLQLKRPKDISYKDLINFNDENLNRWKNFRINDSNGNIFWFRDWYLPIYERLGGALVLNRFYNYTFKYWRRKSDGDYYYMNKGEFVHFWSGAAEVNLLPLAQSAIKWTKKNKQELNRARRNFKTLDYFSKLSAGDVFAPNPADILQITMDDGHANFSLSYYDDNVAFYSTDFKTYPIFFLKLISIAWKYVNENYFHYKWNPPQRLYIVFLQNETIGMSRCSSADTFSQSLQSNHRKVHRILCFNDDADSIPYENIISEIAWKTLFAGTNGGDESSWLAYNVSGWSMTSIILYDIYLTLGQTSDAQLWRIKKLNQSDHFPSNGTFWFRDWYLKIYELNSGENTTSNSPVVRNFFSIILEKQQRMAKENNTNMQLTRGEFLHFWSGAAGLNLKNLTRSLGWDDNDKVEDEWLEARLQYPNFNYTVSEPKEIFPDTFLLANSSSISIPHQPLLLTNVYNSKTDSVGIYFDSTLQTQSLSIVAWQSILFSKLWRYLNTFYTGILDKVDPYLYVMFREKSTKNCDIIPPFTIASKKGDLKLFNVIDCGYVQGNSIAWKANSKDNVEPILNSLDKLVEFRMEFKENDDSMSLAVKWMLRTVIFDMYLKEGRIKDARQWLREHKEKISGIGKKDWFLDWCLPIYYQHGGVSVLNRILSISSKYLNLNTNISESEERKVVVTKNGEIREINIGEFVHLWSGAAKESLKELAVSVFGWNKEIQNELVQARQTWSDIIYECEDCYETQQQSIIQFLYLNDGQTLAILIGIGLGVILLVTCIAFGFIFGIFRRRMKSLRDIIRELTTEEVEEFHRGNNTYVNSDEANAPIHLLPFDSRFEIPKDELFVDKRKVLGSGEFGLVYLGSINRKSAINSESAQVAVKTVKPNVGVNYFKAMLSEIKIMAHLGPHENVASLLATVTASIKTCEVFAAIEYCCRGDLLHFVQRNGANFNDLWNLGPEPKLRHSSYPAYKNEKVSYVKFGSYITLEESACSHNKSSNFSTLDLLQWSYQISNGMAFLSSKNVVHGDLAARNILLTSENVAKISDFGLSRQIYKYSHYTKKSSAPLPWRWMAIESLNEMIFSVHTDVWAFGVTLWEIFTLGKVPYPAMNWDHDFVRSLERGNRLPPPDCGNSEIYDLLTMFCWKKDPKDRLSFPQIRTQIGSIIASLESCAGLHGGTAASYCELE